MEYILSLVGKDQETITEAIKNLAENAEKVKKLEMENSDLHIELEESKEEIHYLKNKLNQKYDLVEDLEHELDKNEEKFEEAKKGIISKENELDELEKVIAE
jgi:predicted RNase H-like nuclease (RuvC/YqgF family)